jgi:hypothetical protein
VGARKGPKPGREQAAYRFLTRDEQDDMIVATMRAQELDLFTHRVNLERYRAIAASRLRDTQLRRNVEQEIPVLVARIEDVEAIIAAVEAQMPPPARAAAAFERLLKAAGERPSDKV